MFHQLGICDSCGGIHRMMFGVVDKTECPHYKANVTPNVELIVPQVYIDAAPPQPTPEINVTVTVEGLRPSFETIFMGLAESISQRATCKRLKVGTVIT